MADIIKATEHHLGVLEKVTSGGSDRRTFLKVAGMTLAAFGIAACSDDTTSPTGNTSGSVNLGSGDIGVLNYAYALEQLEAAFYLRVTSSFYSSANSEERTILTDIKNHEVAHRDFFKAAIPAASRIGDLEVDFSGINFSDRSSVLGAAKTFEDLGVAAYNGAGKLLVSGDYLLLAGKIVSVEARHAAAIRSLLIPKSASFAGDDAVDPATGLDKALMPSAVLAAADAYIKTTINFSQLPTA